MVWSGASASGRSSTGLDPSAPIESLDRYADEVMNGLPNEKADLDIALENQSFYDREGERYLPQRDAESTFDFMGRPKRQSGLLHQAVEILTHHLYAPGPARQFRSKPKPEGEEQASPTDDPAEEFLRRVYTDNLFDGLMRRADGMATLNNVAALQIDAGKEGNWAEKPLTIRLWGREEFHVWTDPDDTTVPAAVVTIDRYNEQTRYRLWNDKEVRTYLTKQGVGTAGGRVAYQVSLEPHDYGVIPFGFVHYDLPVRRFFTPAPGTYLRKSEVRVDDRLSLIDESIAKHLNPVPVAENVPLEWNPILEPQRFIRLFSAGPQVGSEGGFEAGLAARLYYLQANIDVAGAWEDLKQFIEQVFGSCNVPINVVRMEAVQAQSGIAIIAEQAPLLTRARMRRGIFAHFESRIAQTILQCAGGHYDIPQFVEAAKQGKLTLAWAEPTIPIPGPDRDQADANALTLGVKSKLMVIQERYGCTRDQAIEIMQQIAEDRKLEQDILGLPAPGEVPDDTAGDGQSVTDDQATEDDQGKESGEGRSDAGETDEPEPDDNQSDSTHEG